MLSYSEEELRNKPRVNKGDVFLHKECGEMHELKAGKNFMDEEDESILYFTCGERTMLGALNGAWLW